MDALIPASHADLLSDETKTIAFLATLMKDDSPQVTPVWFIWDGQYIWINSAKGRTKDHNMRQHAEVAIAIPDAGASRYLQLRGIVVSITEDKDLKQVNLLAMKYTNQPWKPNSADEVRVAYKIKPEHVSVG